MLPMFRVFGTGEDGSLNSGEIQSFQFLVERAFGDSQPVRGLLDVLVLGCKRRRDVEALQFV